jgi:hypothetical protein
LFFRLIFQKNNLEEEQKMTNQNEAATAAQGAAEDAQPLETLQRLKTEVFDGSDEDLAVAMGRPVEEIRAWLSGAENIDEDAEMKINGIAKERLGE